MKTLLLTILILFTTMAAAGDNTNKYGWRSVLHCQLLVGGGVVCWLEDNKGNRWLRTCDPDKRHNPCKFHK